MFGIWIYRQGRGKSYIYELGLPSLFAFVIIYGILVDGLVAMLLVLDQTGGMRGLKPSLPSDWTKGEVQYWSNLRYDQFHFYVTRFRGEATEIKYFTFLTFFFSYFVLSRMWLGNFFCISNFNQCNWVIKVENILTSAQ